MTWQTIHEISGLLWTPWTFLMLLGTGILFTIWTRFSQYRVLTHGVQVVRGKYDKKDDPGAINHFQALSAALSATIGLGNIGAVALAIGAGGPGALFLDVDRRVLWHGDQDSGNHFGDDLSRYIRPREPERRSDVGHP